MFQLEALQLTDQIKKKFKNLNATELIYENIIRVCYRCKSNLSSKSLNPPAQTKYNDFRVGPIPAVILDLTKIERKLLNRIVPFMNIIHSSGYLQSKQIGHVTHFPLEVEEVEEQLALKLPLTPIQAGVIIIQEKLVGVKHQKPPFRIRPELVSVKIRPASS